MLRKTSAAGRFYPAEPAKLEKFVSSFLAAGAAPAGRCAGLLVPHAGYEYSGAAAGTALVESSIRKQCT